MKPPLHKILALAVFAAGSLVFLRWIPDDAYISFRYALNFADGHGLVFNPGERVEGYSNFLWTLLLGLGKKAGVDIVAAAVALSAAFAFGTVWMALRLFGRVADQTAPGEFADAPSHLLAASLLLVVSLPMTYWATSGLETFPATFFLLLGAVLHMKAEREGRSGAHVGSVVAFLTVALLRPEGIVYFAFNAAVLYVRHARSARLHRSVRVALMCSVVLFAVFLATRSLYYHSIVPNTYWAKPATTWDYFRPLRGGARYLARYFIVSGLAPLIPLAAIAFRRKTGYAVRYLGGLLAIQLAFIVSVGGDVLRFDRFAVAFHPILVSLILAGLLSLETHRKDRRWLRATAWCVVGASLLLGGLRIHRAHSKYCLHDFMQSRFHRMLGEALGEMLPSDATLAFNEVGAVPYYSGLVTYDMLGLTDVTVAAIIYDSYRRFGSTETERCRRGISDYILAREPTCIILPSRGPIDPVGFASPPDHFHPIWYGIYTHPALRSGYRVDFWVEHNPGKRLYVFVRKGIELDHAPLARMGGSKCLRVAVIE